VRYNNLVTTANLSGEEAPKRVFKGVIKRNNKILKAFVDDDEEDKKKKKKKKLEEGLQTLRFKYDGENRTIKKPVVKLLDPYYKGRPEQKTYGQRDDLLGWSLSHVSNREEAENAIDDISDFASMLSANSDEVYKRIKYFYPKQSEFIRRYMRKHINKLKVREDNKWRNGNLNNLVKLKSYNDY
jgi:hypothetical protein